MAYFLIAITACLASLLTFFSGFGLGTILTPVFFLFFPVEVAIMLTAIVHLLNNLFKLLLVGKHTNWKVLLKFGIPGAIAAYGGAYCLEYLATTSSLVSYTLWDKELEVTPVNLVIALLLIAFAIYEISSASERFKFKESAMIPGGLLSGFLGGLSGHQGAMRTAFLINAGLSKEAFIATGVSIACFIDVARLTKYFTSDSISADALSENGTVLLVAVLSAFGGALIGKWTLKKITLSLIQKTVAILMIILAIGLGAGVLAK